MKLMTRQPVNGNRHFEGRLQRFEEWQADPGDDEGQAESEARTSDSQPGKRIEIDLANVEKANLVPEI